MTAINLAYAIQIAVLLGCIYMIWQARAALNSLARGLILLCILLIIRRIDDVFNIFDQVATTILSSIVVTILFMDIYKLYKEREVYALYLRNRQKRIDALEEMRSHSEQSEWNR